MKSVTLIFFIYGLLLFQHIHAENKDDSNVEKVFTDIYRKGVWKSNYRVQRGYGTSGEGSEVKYNWPYLAYLEEFIRDHDIKSVIDLGCGDWEFSKFANWEKIDYYLGIDAVKRVVDFNSKHYSSTKVHFKNGDFLKMDLPAADLVLCKDVLIHLSIAQIHKAIEIMSKYPYVIIVNTIPESEENIDIATGEFRRVNLDTAPFNLKFVSRKSLLYHGAVKEILVMVNKDTSD